jgi:hypothetical protein
VGHGAKKHSLNSHGPFLLPQGHLVSFTRFNQAHVS